MLQPGKPYTLLCEMSWKVDSELTAARKLPHWPRFHQACGEKGLCFDNIERRGKQFVCPAFRVEKISGGSWRAIGIVEGKADTVVGALTDAFDRSGYDIPEASALLAVGLQAERDYAGEEMEAGQLPEADDFDALMDSAPVNDEFSELL